MEEETTSTEEFYYILEPYLNEIQDKLYYDLSHNISNGDFSAICNKLNITEEQGEEIIEQIKEIQLANFPDLK